VNHPMQPQTTSKHRGQKRMPVEERKAWEDVDITLTAVVRLLTVL